MFANLDSKVGIAGDFGLDDREIGVWGLVGLNVSILHAVQTGSGAH
jgi:hypothetical protein